MWWVMNKIVLIFSVLLLSGCERPPRWEMHRECMTSEDKDKAAEMTKVFLASTPKAIGGEDQDWDDAINAAAYRAEGIVCPMVMFEYDNHRRTGRWKNVEQVGK